MSGDQSHSLAGGHEVFLPAALVPAYHCAATVGAVIRGLRVHLPEVLVVDDGSGDDTAAEARAAGARVLERAENGGKGRALRDGLEDLLPRGVTHVAFVDADGQHDPGDLPALLSAARAGSDFVIGSRLTDASRIPRKNYWANTIGDKVLSRMTGLPVEDGQSGYRVISAGLLRRLNLRAERYSIENEILIKAAPYVERFATVPVKTIYGPARSHYRPFRDTWVTSWLSVYYKTLDSDAS